MARSIWLVRHGQASFGKSDYDKLSELGHEQARALGQSLRDHEWRPDRIVCGTMRRHQETLAEVAVAAGFDLPIEVDPRWNEVDHVDIINAYKPAYRNMLVLKADMVRTFRPRAAFEDMFVAAIRRWASGEYDSDYAETFSSFSERTRAALDDVCRRNEQRTLVVSSIGVIAYLASGLLEGGDETMRLLSLAGYNCGVTKLKVDKANPQLLSFNEIGHLKQQRQITNR